MSRRNLGATGQGEPRDLIGALFDFEALPGRYPLTLREPRALFDRSRDVLLLASGRLVSGLELDPLDAPGVQRAACFFVRMAMLRPGADHYTLLGLEPGFKKETLRDHYRMLIRLTHPDFLASSSAWPAGSATRINLANDVLSSVVRKAEYDGLLASGTRRMGPVNRLGAVLPRPMQRERHVAWGWILAGAGMVALVLTLWSGHTDDSYLAQVTSADSLVADAEPGSVAEPISRESPEHLAQAAQAAKEAQAVTVAQAAKEARAAKMAQAAKEAQALKLAEAAKEAQFAKQAQAAKVAQAAKEAETLKLVQAAKMAQAAKEAQALKLAEAAKEARFAKQAQAAKVAEAAKEAQTIKLAQAAKVTQVARAAQEVTVAQAVASLKPPVAAPQLPQSAPASEPTGRLSLVDAQPALNQLIQAMQAGRGEDLLRGLDRSVRQSAGAADLVNAYNFLVGGSRSVRLGPVQLRSRPNADQLAVDGVVQLVLHDQGQPPPLRELRWRAMFAQRDGQVVMTEISAGGARP